ncbi:endonuclease domain-containing protein [Paludicola sp. MB14-C6]|uniref:endonuclease domain-containing protein n=1 Tax=Paludihabitans sp. MB14-C6 TaxID=3070656 RepID=UPI0027DE3007|nr:endonuclease domain-containing protein [Paludicola sp. MB14-C6]WMJ22068.1 endonuclease domain-containing protein [Paludicola sp. MB14-C6]
MYDYNKKLVVRAKQLRKEMTKQEHHLWYDFLRGLSVKVYKQKVIGNYIVDFYCDKAKLVIELDGSQHFTEMAMDYDKERTAILSNLGITVIRFTNQEVEEQFEVVCEKINSLITLSDS